MTSSTLRIEKKITSTAILTLAILWIGFPPPALSAPMPKLVRLVRCQSNSGSRMNGYLPFNIKNTFEFWFAETKYLQAFL